MKSIIFRIVLLIMLAAIFASGCAPAPAPEPETVEVEVTRIVEGETVVEESFRVALIVPSTIDDFAWSQGMYDSLLTVQEKMGGEEMMEIAYSEGLYAPPDVNAAVRDYASEGYDLVIAHGSQFGTTLAQIAPDFPETSFAWGTSTNTFQADGINNIFAYQAEAQEGGYVNGVIAAMMSESGKLGITGPVEAGDAVLYNEGFKAGAEATDPDVNVYITYTGSFGDVSLMNEAANAHIAEGVDMLTGSSQSVTGSITACKEAGAYWFAADFDQAPLAPEIVVASQTYNYADALEDMLLSHKAGFMGGKSYILTFKNGGLNMVYNDAIDIPEDVIAAAEAAIQGIIDGEIVFGE
jgi:basic membrane protein A